MWFDEIQLRFGHNLRVGNAPDFEDAPANLANVVNAKPTDIASFGLFSSSDFHKFHPDATAENVKPKEGDYVSPIYRALSEVIVHKSWNPIDFSENNALKKGMGLLKGQSVKGDHEMGIGTTIGAVDQTFWEESYKIGNDVIPAGINARLKIDSKVNPSIARLVMMDPPGIHSTSVTVGFTWEKSHASLTDDEFWGKLGTYDKDGKLIRRIVSSVKSFKEISLVDHGADPFAKKIGKDGKIVLPDVASKTYVSNSEAKKEQKHFFFDFKPSEEDETSNSENNTIPTDSNDIQTSNSENMKEALVALAALIAFEGLNTEDPASIAALQEAFKKYKGEKEKAETDLAALQNAKPDTTVLTALQSFKEKTLSDARAKATATLQKLHDNKAPEALVNAIASLESVEGINALNDSYEQALNQKYPLSCKKCGSSEVHRGSAATGTQENPKGDKEETPVKLSDAEIRAKKVKNYGSFKTIHHD
jgi:hypothetical protein